MKLFKGSSFHGIALQGYQLSLDVDWNLYAHYKLIDLLNIPRLIVLLHHNFLFTYADKGEVGINFSFSQNQLRKQQDQNKILPFKLFGEDFNIKSTNNSSFIYYNNSC